MDHDNNSANKNLKIPKIDEGRREAITKIGLLSLAAYVAPLILTISSAHASGGSGGGSGGVAGGGSGGGSG